MKFNLVDSLPQPYLDYCIDTLQYYGYKVIKLEGEAYELIKGEKSLFITSNEALGMFTAYIENKPVDFAGFDLNHGDRCKCPNCGKEGRYDTHPDTYEFDNAVWHQEGEWMCTSCMPF